MMKLNNVLRRIVSALLCATLVFVAIGAYTPEVEAKSLSSLKGEYSKIKDKVKESEAKVAELEKQQATQEDIINELNIQISRLNDELANVQSQKDIISGDIAETNAKIENINNEIADLNTQIAQKEVEIDETVELFCERMRANYMAGKTSAIEMLASSSSFSSFLNRLELFRRVTEDDQQLVDDLNEEIASIESMQLKLEQKKAGLETEKTNLEMKKGDLQTAENQLSGTQANIIAKSKEVNAKLQALNYQTQKLEVSIEQYNAEMDKIDKEIEAYIKNNSASSTTPSYGNSNITSSGWQWPVPYSSSYITSPYGYRIDPAGGYYKFHQGIDISMPNAKGKNLVATKAGTVILVSYQARGYGNYLIIDHGNGFSSVYGHCNSVVAKQGQKVEQGQVVAYIGSTGYSTGPHVHFEIRYNGQKMNPSNYVRK